MANILWGKLIRDNMNSIIHECKKAYRNSVGFSSDCENQYTVMIDEEGIVWQEDNVTKNSYNGCEHSDNAIEVATFECLNGYMGVDDYENFDENWELSDYVRLVEKLYGLAHAIEFQTWVERKSYCGIYEVNDYAESRNLSLEEIYGEIRDYYVDGFADELIADKIKTRLTELTPIKTE